MLHLAFYSSIQVSWLNIVINIIQNVLAFSTVWKIWMPQFLNVMWAVCMCMCARVCVCEQNKCFATILWCLCVATQHTPSDPVNEVCTVVNCKISLLCWLLLRFFSENICYVLLVYRITLAHAIFAEKFYCLLLEILSEEFDE